MHFIETGQHMTQLAGVHRRSSPIAVNTLVFATALLLAPLAFTGPAQAQTLGYAPMQPLAFPQDNVTDTPQASEDAALPERLRRTVVNFDSSEPAGTIIIDTGSTALYYVLGHGRAIRYGVGVGRQGFTWSGVQTISRKAEWPDWQPPAEMIARQPYLPRFVAGGPGNPLGARAMHLGGTVYRIHGTNLPQTIGTAISSGCFRLVNNDVIDLYDRVPVGTKVIVHQKPSV